MTDLKSTKSAIMKKVIIVARMLLDPMIIGLIWCAMAIEPKNIADLISPNPAH